MNFTKKLKKVKIVSGIALLAAIVILVFVGYFDFQQQDSQAVTQIEEKLLPTIIANNVSFYLDSSWCQAIVYNDRIAQKLTDPSANNKCLDNATQFTDEDVRIFTEIKSISQNEKLGVMKISYEKYQNNSVGISFHNDCAFCGLRYLYTTSTVQFVDVEREVKYKQINSNWYKIKQDVL